MAFLVTKVFALDARTVRVVFDAEPRHESPIGLADALNPSQYTLTVAVGSVPVPAILKAHNARAGTGGTWSVDLSLTRETVTAATYQIEVSGNIRNDADTEDLTPASVQFAGRGTFVRRSQNVSVRHYDVRTVEGRYEVAQGDLAGATATEAYKARVVRRGIVVRGAFRFSDMADYGFRPPLKQQIRTSDLQALKGDATRQIRAEPETDAAAVGVSLFPQGILYEVKARPRAADPVSIEILNPTDGPPRVDEVTRG